MNARSRTSNLLQLTCLLAWALIAPAQPAAKLPVFDVVSIHPSKAATNGFRVRFLPDGTVSVVNAPLLAVIRQAFSLFNSNDDQISGLPSWAKSDRFDIQAKVAEADVPAMKTLLPEQRALMLQALLADRFALVAHKETRQLPVYALVIAKGGPRLKEADPAATYPNGMQGPDGKPVGAGMIRMGRDFLEAQAIPISQLLGMLTQATGRTVLDKTGLTGRYDIALKWAPEEPGMLNGAPAPPPDPSLPSIFTAVQEQLGLRLESQRGPVDVVVVEHLDKPTEN